jgi:PAT family acetyl-CoA transporter-like MFS transporter 1
VSKRRQGGGGAGGGTGGSAGGGGAGGLAGDYSNIALLLLLYTLQGVPLGLAQTMDTILQEKQLSFEEQGVFSFMSWPYSLKILWAPVVDAVFVASFGRRKSWLVPMQLLLGALMLLSPPYVRYLLDGNESARPMVVPLTCLFFMFYLLAATQDIAVDGWAVEMLQRHNIGWASTCNAIGQTLGYMLAFALFLLMQKYDLCSLEQFMRFWGVVFLVVTAAVALFKREKGGSEMQAALAPQRRRLAQEELAQEDGRGREQEPWDGLEPLLEAREQGQGQGHSQGEGKSEADAAAPETVAHAYAQMAQVMFLPGVQALMVLLLTRGVAFAAADSLAQRKLVMSGMPKDAIASLTVVLTPLSLVLPGVLSAYVSDRPLAIIKRGYLPRVALGLASAALVATAPDFKSGEEMHWAFYAALVTVLIVHTVLSTAMFVAMMAFFAKVSDPAIGGTYMTLLNTMANLGSKWPSQAVLFIVDLVTLRDAEQVVVLDGFFVASALCFAAGLAWFARFAPELDRLEDLDMSKWRVSKATSQKRR